MKAALQCVMRTPALVLGLVAAVASMSGALAQESVKVQITKKDCARVVAHVPADDVAYKAGVDVRGKSVAPADLAGSTSSLPIPDILEFDIAFSPLSGTSKSTFGETSLSVGKIRYDINKRKITLNGQPIGDDGLAELGVKCQEILGSRK